MCAGSDPAAAPAARGRGAGAVPRPHGCLPAAGAAAAGGRGGRARGLAHAPVRRHGRAAGHARGPGAAAAAGALGMELTCCLQLTPLAACADWLSHRRAVMGCWSPRMDPCCCHSPAAAPVCPHFLRRQGLHSPHARLPAVQPSCCPQCKSHPRTRVAVGQCASHVCIVMAASVSWYFWTTDEHGLAEPWFRFMLTEAKAG